MLDYKITKKHYPRTNSNSVLEFIFEKDPNLFLKKNKILIRGSIEIDDKYVLENGWVSKTSFSIKDLKKSNIKGILPPK